MKGAVGGRRGMSGLTVAKAASCGMATMPFKLVLLPAQTGYGYVALLIEGVSELRFSPPGPRTSSDDAE